MWLRPTATLATLFGSLDGCMRAQVLAVPEPVLMEAKRFGKDNETWFLPALGGGLRALDRFNWVARFSPRLSSVGGISKAMHVSLKRRPNRQLTIRPPI